MAFTCSAAALHGIGGGVKEVESPHHEVDDPTNRTRGGNSFCNDLTNIAIVSFPQILWESSEDISK